LAEHRWTKFDYYIEQFKEHKGVDDETGCLEGRVSYLEYLVKTASERVTSRLDA